MKALLENLNKEQLAAVTHTGGPLLIVAGAGTGKTTVITRRIAYLLEQKLARPQEILALTFTEKAATEMEERVDKLVPLGTFDLHISTFHAFCERILKQHALDIGLPNSFRLLETAARWILVYKNFDRFKLNYYRPLGNPSKFIDALLYHFDKCKDELISPENYLQYAEGLRLSSGSDEVKGENAAEAERVEEIANAYHIYRQLLINNEFLDFGDLINYTLELFQKRPKVLAYYRNLFRHIMVDEFQDTNFAQYQLVKMLTGSNLVVVGDDDQSIYKFRGASVSNILKLKEDFPKLEQIALVKNYRSSQKILDLAYSFIQANNPNRLESTLRINKKLINPLRPGKGIIEVLEASDLSSELAQVINKITDLKSSDQEASWNDFAVLIRANSAADELLPKLEAAQVPYYFVANTGLYKKPIIAGLIGYIKLLGNFQDNRSLIQALSLPKFRIDPQDFSKLAQFSQQKTLSLFEALSSAEARAALQEESRKNIDRLLTYLQAHAKGALEVSAAEIFVHIVKDLGLDQQLSAETFENAQDRELLEQFFKKIERHSQDNTDRSLNSFLEDLTLEMMAGDEGEIKFDPNSGPESLKVMTIHSTKGLEFKYVFVINMVDQRFPTRQRRESIEIPAELVKDILPEGDFHLQEERRLFYVAITRARSHLYFSWAKDYGGKQLKKPSSFLIETGLVPGEKVNRATGQVLFSKPEKKKPVVFKDLPKSYSYSAIMQFIRCPLEFKYRYYLKIPWKGSASLSFGTTIHRTLQLYLEKFAYGAAQKDLFGAAGQIVLPSYEVLEELYEQSWVDDWYASKGQKEEYRKKGRELLKKFYERSLTEIPSPRYLESSFKLDLGAEKYKFTGKIDRADNAGQGLEIIDYKTGRMPAAGKPGDIDQLIIYQWAAEEYLNESVKSLRYWYLDSDEFREVPTATKEHIENLKTKLLETIKQIEEAIKFDLFSELDKKIKVHDCEFRGMP